jgi:hypothetical protein
LIFSTVIREKRANGKDAVSMGLGCGMTGWPHLHEREQLGSADCDPIIQAN